MAQYASKTTVSRESYETGTVPALLPGITTMRSLPAGSDK